MTSFFPRLAGILLAGLCIFAPAHAVDKDRSKDGHHHDSGPKAPLPWKADPFPSTYAPLPRGDTLIVDATILDGAGHRFEHGSVLLRDGKVAAIGDKVAAPAGAKTIDAHGRWVTPGIIDVHSHDGDFALPFTSKDLETGDTNESTDPVTPQVWAEHSITVQDPSFARALAGGVTTLQILPG